MNELERRLRQHDAHQVSAAAANTAKTNDLRSLSGERAQSFLDMMRSRGIGATALELAGTHNVIVGGLWKGYRRATAFSYEPLGEGWLISSGPHSHYERVATNWMIMDDETQAPRVVVCTPPIHELPLMYGKSPYGPPETPFAVLLGENLNEATVPTPFATEQQFGWLILAASELTKASVSK